MPWRNGLYVRLQSWVARAAAGAPISATEFDADGNDEATALNNCILRDGTGSPTADIPFAGHSLTGMRKAVAPGEPVEFSQLASAAGVVANRLQNASFLVNQRGVSSPVTLAASGYGHDRWKAGASGAAYSFGLSGADVQATITSGSLVQIVPATDVDSATMTLSNAGTAQGRVYPVGSASPAFAPCPLTVTNLTPGQAVIVEFSTGSVLEPQLEPGGTAHSFARRAFSTDTYLCQALYEVMPYRLNFLAGNGGNATINIPFLFRSRKYLAPAITNTITSNPLANTFQASDITVDGFTFGLTNNGGNYVGMAGVVTASCEP